MTREELADMFSERLYPKDLTIADIGLIDRILAAIEQERKEISTIDLIDELRRRRGNSLCMECANRSPNLCAECFWDASHGPFDRYVKL